MILPPLPLSMLRPSPHTVQKILRAFPRGSSFTCLLPLFPVFSPRITPGKGEFFPSHLHQQFIPLYHLSPSPIFNLSRLRTLSLLFTNISSSPPSWKNTHLILPSLLTLIFYLFCPPRLNSMGRALQQTLPPFSLLKPSQSCYDLSMAQTLLSPKLSGISWLPDSAVFSQSSSFLTTLKPLSPRTILSSLIPSPLQVFKLLF